jgi:hypothetical protein
MKNATPQFRLQSGYKGLRLFYSSRRAKAPLSFKNKKYKKQPLKKVEPKLNKK